MATTSRSRSRGTRAKAKPKRPVWQRALLWGLAAVAVAATLGLAAFVVLYLTTDVPEPNDFATSETTIVYYAGGKQELGRFSTENRVSVPLADVPDHVQKAVLAAEDRTFYENRGISPTGIGRAVWNNLRGGSTQGGSTITQQYVKNYYLTQDQTVTRKVREIILALKIDQTLSKDQILEDYLNTVYFGRGAYGIETAAQAWFGADASDLTVAQGAVLAAALQSPSNYDPASGKKEKRALAQRFDYVVQGMVSQGWLSDGKAASLDVPAIKEPSTRNQLGGPEGYLLQMVRQELVADGFSEQQIDSGGLRVSTTFSKQAQRSVVEAVRTEFPTVDAARVHVGVAAVEPGTGAIRAIYGGRDYVARSLNNATQAFIPGGSTFKAFTLTAALEDGVSLDSRFAGNSPYVIPGDDNPATREVDNEGDASYGSTVDMWYATEQSINTAFVDLTMTIGPEAVVDAAARLGIPRTLPDGEPNGLLPNARVTLGTASVSPLQMAAAYAALGAEGVYAEPFSVARVRTASGELLYENEREPDRVVDADVVSNVTAALERVVSNGTGAEAQRLGRPAAGKTGTAGPDGDTQSSWFIGYTPQLAAAVGFYRGNGSVAPEDDLDGVGGLPTFFGGAYPARIWTTFMTGAMEGVPVEEFPPAADIGEATQAPQPQQPVAPATPQPRPEPKPTPTPTPTPAPRPTPAPEPEPTPTATPAPTPPPPEPTPEPTPPPGGDVGGPGGGGGGGQQA